MAKTLKPKPNHSNGSVQKSQDRKKHVKFAHCSLFSSIAIAWYIMNSCHKVVCSIRHTTLKLCANCSKQFVRNAQNCGKTNHGFCTMTKNKTVIMPHLPYSRNMAPANFFLFPKLKTPKKGKRFATIEEIKEKSKQKLLALPKSAFQKFFEHSKKRWHRCIISEGLLWRGQDSYW